MTLEMELDAIADTVAEISVKLNEQTSMLENVKKAMEEHLNTLKGIKSTIEESTRIVNEITNKRI